MGGKSLGMREDQDFLESGAFRKLNDEVRERVHRE